MSTLQGKLRQESKGGQFYYRVTIAQGNRREFSLGTSDLDEACKKAVELDSIWLAPTSEVALAQMNAIRGFSMHAQKITFEEAWDKYQVHQNRATPHTVEERIGYRKTFEEFTRFATGGSSSAAAITTATGRTICWSASIQAACSATTAPATRRSGSSSVAASTWTGP